MFFQKYLSLHFRKGWLIQACYVLFHFHVSHNCLGFRCSSDWHNKKEFKGLDPNIFEEVLAILEPLKFCRAAQARGSAFWRPAPRVPQCPCQPWVMVGPIFTARLTDHTIVCLRQKVLFQLSEATLPCRVSMVVASQAGQGLFSVTKQEIEGFLWILDCISIWCHLSGV